MSDNETRATQVIEATGTATMTGYSAKEDEQNSDAIKKIDYSTDKFFRVGWDGKETKKDPTKPETDRNGFLYEKVNVASTEDKNNGKDIILKIVLSPLFTDGKGAKTDIFLKNLSPYKKLVYIALHNIFVANKGREVVTSCNNIYRAMGKTGNAGEEDIQKIYETICEFISTGVEIDNREEAAAYNRKTFSLEKTRMVEGRIWGEKRIDGKIKRFNVKIFEDLVFFRYSKEMKEFTSIDDRLLQMPLKFTDANIMLNFMLIDRILYRIKNPIISRIIDVSKIHSQMKDDEGDQGQIRLKKYRTKGKIKNLFEHYKSIGFIKDFAFNGEKLSVELFNDNANKRKRVARALPGRSRNQTQVS